MAMLLLAMSGLVLVLAPDGEREGPGVVRETRPVPPEAERTSSALLRPASDVPGSAALGSRAPMPSTIRSTGTEHAPSADGASAAVERTEGTLAGRWTDPQGGSVKEMRFQVVPVDPSLTPGYAERAQGYFAHGRTSASVTTDLDGRFSVPGMCPGEYLATEDVETGWRVLGGPFATDREARMVTAPYRIELVILDAEGRPLPPRVEADLEEEHAFCSPLSFPAAGKRSRVPASGSVAGRPLSDGTVVFPVEPEGTYLVGYSSRFIPTRFREVHVPRERCCTRLEIQLPVPMEPGELDLTILTPEGTPLDDSEWSQVHIHEAESGRAVPWGREGIRQGGHRGPSFRCELAPGSYDVRVEAQPYEGCVRWPRVAEYSPAERRIEILPGVRADVAIALRGSGRLELTVARPFPVSDSLFSGGEVALDLDAWLESVRRHGGGCRVSLLEASSERSLPVDFFVRLPKPGGASQGAGFLPWTGSEFAAVPWVLPGRSSRSSTPIPPGEYVVEVELPCGRVFRDRATIEHGKMTSLAFAP